MTSGKLQSEREARRKHLQNICDSLKRDYHYQFTIEFRAGDGWWAVASVPRWKGDKGTRLSARLTKAERIIRTMLSADE